VAEPYVAQGSIHLERASRLGRAWAAHSAGMQGYSRTVDALTGSLAHDLAGPHAAGLAAQQQFSRMMRHLIAPALRQVGFAGLVNRGFSCSGVAPASPACRHLPRVQRRRHAQFRFGSAGRGRRRRPARAAQRDQTPPGSATALFLRTARGSVSFLTRAAHLLRLCAD